MLHQMNIYGKDRVQQAIEERKKAGLETDWKTGEEVLSWWFSDKR